MAPRVLPKWKFFLPDAVHDWRFRRSLRRHVAEAQEVLHVTDGDLDGAACDVIVREAHGDDATGTFYASPYDLLRTLRLVADEPGDGRHLVVSDLSIDRDDADEVLELLQRLVDGGWRITWRDHHHKQWSDAVRAQVRDMGVELHLDTTGERCTTNLVQEDLAPDDEFAEELARVVRDYDLWLQEEPWSQVLNDAVYEMGRRRFVHHLLEHRDVHDSVFQERHEAGKARKEAEAAWGVEHATMHVGNEAVVAVTYGSGPTNDTLHELMETHGAHLGIMLRPESSFSLRSRDPVKVCHLVAGRHGGGGHPNASGGKLDIPMWDLPRYWVRRSKHPAVQALLQDALEHVDLHLAGELDEDAN